MVLKRAVVDVLIIAAVAAGAAYVMGRAPDGGPVYLTAKIERGKVMTMVTAVSDRYRRPSYSNPPWTVVTS